MRANPKITGKLVIRFLKGEFQYFIRPVDIVPRIG